MSRVATPLSKLLSYTHLSSSLSPPLFPTHLRSMSHHNPTHYSPSPSPSSSPSSTAAVRYSPDVSKLHNLFTDDPSSGWKRSWEERLTPWDLQGPTPVVLKLLESESLPKGRALVPGCGSGYDVVALASPECFVVGIDISEVAIKKARELASSSTNANYLSFLLADFFTWEPTDLFDLIFDYTFFCAIEPHLRPAWASRMRDLLKPNGELITLMFPIDDHDGGPPYKTSVSDYEKVLHPLGFKATLIEDNELAVAPRKGREKLGRWRRVTTMSSL